VVTWQTADARARTAALGALDAATKAHPALRVSITDCPNADPYGEIRRRWAVAHPLNPPELVVIKDTWLPELAKYLQPLDAREAGGLLADCPEPVKQRLRFAGRTYGVPWRVDANALYYSRECFSAAGVLPPRTWDELLVAARRCHRPPAVYGFGLPGVRDSAGAELLLQLLWAQGGDLPAVGDIEALDKAAAAAALGRYQALHAVSEPEVLSWDREGLEEFFATGRIAMMVADSTFQDDLAHERPEFAFATTALPTAVTPTGAVSVEMLCAFRASRGIEAGMKVLQALTSAEASERLLEAGGVPFHRAVIESRRHDPRYAPYIANLAECRGFPVQQWGSVSEALSETLAYLLSGRKTLDEAVDALAVRLTQGEPVRPRLEP